MRANEFVKEGVNDPAIFKVVFVVGGPGSGKSYVSRELGLTSMGFVTLNSDVAFEYLMKKHDINPKMPPEEKEKRDIVRARAKELTGMKSDNAIEGRLGIHIDGTGDDYEKIANLKNNFERLGYDTALVVVNTKLEVARQRNQMRDRTVPDKLLVNSWYNVQDNIGRFANIFNNISIIDNSGDKDITDQQIDKTYVRLKKFAQEKPTKPAAKQWIKDHSTVNEKWSKKYKSSINCNNPKGFSQRAHCQGRKKKANEEYTKDGTYRIRAMTYEDQVEEVRSDKLAKFINASLKKAGYKKLGYGQDASVWMKDQGTVVKIIMPEEDPATSITRMELFYKFVKANPKLENLPKFKKSDGQEFFQFVLGGVPFVQFSMEQLQPIPKNTLDENVVWLMSDYVSKGDWKTFYKLLPDYLAKESGEEYSNQFKELPKQKIDQYAKLFNTMKLAREVGRKYDFGWDLHTENVMQRSDGTLVITDPWY